MGVVRKVYIYPTTREQVLFNVNSDIAVMLVVMLAVMLAVILQ